MTIAALSTNLPEKAWHSLPAEDALNALGTHYTQGLSTEEARRRLKTFG